VPTERARRTKKHRRGQRSDLLVHFAGRVPVMDEISQIAKELYLEGKHLRT